MSDKHDEFFAKQLGDLTKHPFHALIISAKSDTTCRQAALWLAKRLSAQTLEVEPTGQSIKIEQIRSLYTSTSHRRNGQTQAVIIHNAEIMTEPAQNALLKLLEEPPVGVHFLLLCSSAEQLLPTIRSRCISRELRGLNKSEFSEWWLGNKSNDDIERLFLLSGGDPILAETEAMDEGSAVQAKRLMSMPLLNSLGHLNKANLDRAEVASLIRGMTLIAEHSIKMAKNKDDLARWVVFAGLCLSSQQQLKRLASTKLIAARLLLGLRRYTIM